MLKYSYVGFTSSIDDGTAIFDCETICYLFEQLKWIKQCGYTHAIVFDNEERVSYYLNEVDLRTIFAYYNNIQYKEAYRWLFEKCERFEEA